MGNGDRVKVIWNVEAMVIICEMYLSMFSLFPFSVLQLLAQIHARLLLISFAIWDVYGAASSWLPLIGFCSGSEARCVGTAPGWGSSLSAGAARPLSAHLSLFGASISSPGVAAFSPPHFSRGSYHITYGKFSFFVVF